MVKKKAYKIKLATVVHQNFPSVHSPMLQIMAQPQTKNYLSEFNSRASDFMLEARRILRGEVFNVTFAVTSVYGVSCDSEYVKNQLRCLLRRKIESNHTDVNHNADHLR